MGMKKCEYCMTLIEHTKIRCDQCNIIWNEGVKFGEENIQKELKAILAEESIL